MSITLLIMSLPLDLKFKTKLLRILNSLLGPDLSRGSLIADLGLNQLLA